MRLSVLGVHQHLNDLEQECQRPAQKTRTQTLLNPVLREDHEAPASKRPSRREPQVRCSAFCGRRRTKRGSTLQMEILGTALTCSTGVCVSTSFKMSAYSFPLCGTGTSRICTMGARSARCSTKCCWTRPAALLTRRPPHRTTRRTPGEEGASVVITRRAPRAPPPQPWQTPDPLRCGATLRRSWRRNCLSRRCRRLIEAARALSTSITTSTA